MGKDVLISHLLSDFTEELLLPNMKKKLEISKNASSLFFVRLTCPLL